MYSPTLAQLLHLDLALFSLFTMFRQSNDTLVSQKGPEMCGKHEIAKSLAYMLYLNYYQTLLVI